jgi:hypothetical protein
MNGIVARTLSSWLPRLPRAGGAAGVIALTGISEEAWRELARVYTGLPAGAGRAAARQRARLARLASRALSSGRWDLCLRGRPPDAEPCLYVSAHVGSLQVLRYALRARGVPAATVLGRHSLDRRRAETQDRVFDRHHPLNFPHALPSSAVHRLRSALKRGSLVAAADLPERGGLDARLLGGPLLVDPRPFRFARAAGVRCRAAFVTLPGGHWTLTLSGELPRGERAACEEFARFCAEVAAHSPADLDGVVYGSIALRGQ